MNNMNTTNQRKSEAKKIHNPIGNSINNIIRNSFCIFIAVQLIGCTKESEFNTNPLPIVIGDLKNNPEQNNNKEFQKQIEQILKYDEYTNKIGAIDCYIDIQLNNCVKISSIIKNNEANKIILYIVESAYPLDEQNQLITSHVASGFLKFMKFELISERLTLVALSQLIGCGPYGTPCEPVTYKFGSTNELGWVTKTGDMHQGYSGSSLSIYAENDNKITQILEVQTSYSNGGAINPEDESKEIISIDSKITTVPQENKKYFDLDVSIIENIIEGKKEDIKKSKFLIKYDDKIKSYNTLEIIKVFESKDKY